MELIKRGKVKDVYRLDSDKLIFRFSDRVSAFDKKFKDKIPNKGKILSKFSTFWFEKLNVQNHYLKRLNDNEIIVRELEMIPLECIVRGYFFGSLVRRVRNNKKKLPSSFPREVGKKFPYPIFDPTTKSDIDIPIEKEEILNQKMLNRIEYDWIKNTSLTIYNDMSKILDEKGFILVDLKLEFGRVGEKIVLGDSIGPDEYRLWKKDDYEKGIYTSFDKQILRDWLIQKQIDTEGDYLDFSSVTLTDEIILKLSDAYKESYNIISG